MSARGHRPLAVGGLLVLFALLVFSIGDKSPTADEQNHLARGLAYLKTGDLRLSQEHPPGINAWEAWPLLLDPRVALPLESASWANAEWYGFADQLLWRVNNHPQAMIWATRLPVIWLTCLLGALAFRWAGELGGIWAGRLALLLITFDPNLLAHGRLTTTDMGVAALSAGAMYGLWRAVRRPTWGRWSAAGLLFGLAQLSKFSALALAPVILAVGAAGWWQDRRRKGGPTAGSRQNRQQGAVPTTDWEQDPQPVVVPAGLSLRRWTAGLLTLYVVGGLVVWAGYRFTWGPIAPLGGLPGPAPAYWSGIASILQRTGGGSPAYLMGQISRDGWWYYHPLAFAIKTPLPTLALLAAALWSWSRSALRRRSAPVGHVSHVTPQSSPPSTESSASVGHVSHLAPQPSPSSAEGTAPVGHVSHVTPGTSPEHSREPQAAFAAASLCLLLPALAYGAMAVGSSFDIGYRHILPTLPLLYIWAGWQLGTPYLGTPLSRAGPDLGPPLSRVGRGTRKWHAWRAALLGGLALWLVGGTLAIAPHYLAYFNALAGGPDGGMRFLVDSNLDWGQDLPALARYVTAHDIDRVYLSWFGAAHPEAYDLPFHPLPGYWRFRGDPAAFGYNPYAPAAGTYAISATNLQGVALDDPNLYAWFRTQTPIARIGHSILIYHVDEPVGKPPALVLGVPTAALAEPERALLARGARLRHYDPSSGIILPLAPSGGEVWFAAPEPPGGALPYRDGPGYLLFQLPLPAPGAPEVQAQFGDAVLLLGHGLERVSTDDRLALTLTMRWQVARPPHRAAVTFAHVLDAEGRYVAGWDGVTAPATCWEAGDELRQRYPIELPGELPRGYQIEVGWYDVETLERWPCYVDGAPAGDRFLIREGVIER